jgi:hypothetical protein
VEGGWKYNAETRKIEIGLTQTQAGEAFRLPLEVGVAAPDAAQVKIEKIEMTGKEQRFEIAADKEPVSVELDPNTWILVAVKFVKR